MQIGNIKVLLCVVTVVSCALDAARAQTAQAPSAVEDWPISRGRFVVKDWEVKQPGGEATRIQITSAGPEKVAISTPGAGFQIALSFDIGGFGGATAQRTDMLGGAEHYIPKTRRFTQDDITYDFRSLQDYSFRPPSPLRFMPGSNNVEEAQNLPDRFIQFLGRKEDGKTIREVGYALGYSLIHGITQPAQRSQHANSAIMLYTSSKSYPVAIDSKMGPIIPAGTPFYCIAYRQYFRPAAQQHATCFYFHQESGDTVVYADYHKNVERDVLKLPAELTDKSITVIEKTPSVTLHSTGTVPPGGATVSVAGDYGYIVLKVR